MAKRTFSSDSLPKVEGHCILRRQDHYHVPMLGERDKDEFLVRGWSVSRFCQTRSERLKQGYPNPWNQAIDLDDD